MVSCLRDLPWILYWFLTDKLKQIVTPLVVSLSTLNRIPLNVFFACYGLSDSKVTTEQNVKTSHSVQRLPTEGKSVILTTDLLLSMHDVSEFGIIKSSIFATNILKHLIKKAIQRIITTSHQHHSNSQIFFNKSIYNFY